MSESEIPASPCLRLVSLPEASALKWDCFTGRRIAFPLAVNLNLFLAADFVLSFILIFRSYKSVRLRS